MKTSLRILPAILAIAAVSSFALSPAKKDWDSEAAKRKAADLLYEAQNAFVAEEYGKYIAVLDRAFELDSTDPGITNEWAIVTISSEVDSLDAKGERAYNYLRNNFFNNPDNYITGSIFAEVAEDHERYADLVRTRELLDSVFPLRNETAFNLATAYLYAYNSGDTAAFDKAIKVYDRLEKGSGKTQKISTHKCAAYLLKGDTVSAVSELIDLADSSPFDSNIMLFTGEILEYVGKQDLAKEYIDKACELDSANGDAFLARARYYRDMGDSVAFDREVFHALKSTKLDVEPKVEILRTYVAELYTDSTQEDRIRQLFNELQQINAGEPSIHTLYAAYLMALNDTKGAIEQFTYAVELDPANSANWYQLIASAASAEDAATIEKYAPLAMEREPDELYYPIVLASTYMRMDNPQKGIEVMNSVQIDEIRNPKAVANFISFNGDLYAAAGDTAKALEKYDEAISLDPENSLALNNSAYFMAVNGIDLDKAREYSERSLKEAPLNPTYLDTYAWILFKQKEYKEAKEAIDTALAMYGINTVPDTSDEAEEVEQLSDEELIEEEIEESTETPSSEIYDHAGDIYFMNGENVKALEYWEKALELDPGNELIALKVRYKTIVFSKEAFMK